MSQPSSPAPNAVTSRATTPESSKAIAEQLTPRSKVKALLAALDDDSEEEPTRKRPEERVDEDAAVLEPSASLGKATPFQDDEGEDDDDEDVVVPRGKLARRLHDSNKDEEDTLSASDDDNGDAYERVRRRLLQKQEVNAKENPAREESEGKSEGEVAPKKFGGFLRRKQKPEVASRDKEAIQPATRQPLSQEDSGLNGDEAMGYSSQANGASDIINREGDDATNHDSDPDLPSNPLRNKRFEALVARKREERLAREAAEEAKHAERARARASTSGKGARGTGTSDTSEADSADEDNEENNKLTQHSRPARKASKRAMEEMTRETQRLSRNMQLAHEAKTRKKISKDSLLERFKPKKSLGITQIQASSSTVNSSAPTSDAEGARDKQTPLTTPERTQTTKLPKTRPMTIVPETSLLEPDGDEDLPTLGEVMSSQVIDKGKGKDPEIYPDTTGSYLKSRSIVDKGKGKDPELYPSEKTTLESLGNQQIAMSGTIPESRKPTFTQRPIKLRPPKNPVTPQDYYADSSSDLEIVPAKSLSGKTKILDRLPTGKSGEDKSLIRLRALAHLSSPGQQKRSSDKTSMTPTELGSALRRQARVQAARERAEKLQELRRKGVIIQSSEERQRDQLAVEDMIERARADADKLAKKEKEEVKKEKRENGEEDGLDSSDDEEYVEGGEVPSEDDADVELSGSEDEGGDEHNEEEEDVEADGEEEDEIEDEEKDAEQGLDGLIDDVASQDDDDEDEDIEDEDNEVEDTGDLVGEQSEEESHIPQVQRRRKILRVSDDEDDDVLPKTPKSTAILESSSVIANPFGQQAGAGSAPMGLTQAFAATMADSQLGLNEEEDSLAALGALTAPEFPELEMDSIVRDSQARETQEPEIDLHFTQSQILPDSIPLERAPVATQFSQIPDPSQDIGFEKSSPITSRFVALAPPSTVDTVIIPQELVQESPVVKRKGRLRKRAQAVAVFSDEENEDQAPTELEEVDVNAESASGDAFEQLKKAAKKAKKREELFNKQKSAAKDVVEEQAVESEDEYAGLGGASDDSEGEDDEEIKKMIDETEVKDDERKTAAYFAEKSRASDEVAIAKLYKDINSGALRRKRGAGADFDDLDDSDDDAEARQRRKRREFARMRKALMESDSNVGKIAEDPKKAAFLRAIEDRENDEDEDDAEYLEETPRDRSQEDDGETQDVIPDSQAENRPPSASAAAATTVAAPSLKRKRGTLTDPKPQPNANPRRTIASAPRKPTTLADIRDSLSFLTEDPAELLNKPLGPSLFEPSSDMELDDADLDFAIDDDGIPTDPIGQPTSATSYPDNDRENDNEIGEGEGAMEPPPPKKTKGEGNPRRTGPNTHPVPTFIDRLSLKRSSSSLNTSSLDLGSKMAFFAGPSAAAGGGGSFKTPALIRRATSSFSVDHVSGRDGNGISTRADSMSKSTSGGMVQGSKGGGAGGKRSSVNWYAREQERKAVLEKKRGRGGKEKGRGGKGGMGEGKGGGGSGGGGGLGGLLGRTGSWE